MLLFFNRTMLETRIYGLQEHVCRPRSRSCTITIVKVRCDSRRLYLVEGCAVREDHCSDTIAYDRQHVPVFGYLVFVAQAPASRDDQRAAFALVLVNGLVQNVVQGRNLPLHAAAILYVTERISRCGQDIASDDNVGAAELHDA